MTGWTTERAVQLATDAHEATGVTDPGDGSPYITHPLRVMRAVRDAGYDGRYQRVAVLHDVLEDTELTEDRLRDEGASEEEIAAVLAVTKAPGDGAYTNRVRKAAADPIGGVVKGFDMLDNSDPARLAAFTRTMPVKARRVAAKYREGLALLDDLRPGWRQA